MTGRSDRRSQAFFAWEAKGRGVAVSGAPVPLEPPFSFPSTFEPGAAEDDGRRPTRLAGYLRAVSEWLAPPPPPAPKPVDADAGDAREVEDATYRELRAHLPTSLKVSPDAYDAFFRSLSGVSHPVGFEMLASADSISVQFAVAEEDERLVRRQLEAFFPDVAIEPVEGALTSLWGADIDAPRTVVEFALGREFLIPFAPIHGDPFVALTGALSTLSDGEAAVFQVLFSPLRAPWQDAIIGSVTRPDGAALFVNAPELLPGAREKTSRALYAAVVRLGVTAGSDGRMWEIACDVASALGPYGTPSGNELVPLSNEAYPADEHASDLLSRRSRRSGMILNARELSGFVHFPGAEVTAPRLRVRAGKTKPAPKAILSPGILLGTNTHHGVDTPVTLDRSQRARHLHVIGVSGTGKSTLLYNLIRQDIERGEGVTVIDPHGDLIDRVLGAIPEERIDDVVLLDPSDERHVVGFNILSARSDWDKNLLASDLVAVFRRLSSAWGDQLNSVLHNAILAFLKSTRGGTLLDLRRFLLEPAFRNEFLATVPDEHVTYYWQKAFPQLSGNKSVGSVVTRLDTFLSPESIRRMVSARENRLDLGEIMDGGKILLAKLSQGAIGRDNSHLLGSLLVAKLQSEAMSRQRQAEASRRYHWAYLDEFHDFLTPSLAESLSGVRKYRLGLTLSHQELRQVERDPDVASALLSNAYTRVVFRVGDKDARTLEHGFSALTAADIQNLGIGEAVCRIERSSYDFNLRVPLPTEPDKDDARRTRERVIEASRVRYASPVVDASPPPAGDPPKKAAPAVPAASAPAPVAEPVAAAEEPVARKAQPVAAREAPAEPELPREAPSAGRGGAQHTTIQKRLKAAAESIGFRATVEKAVLDGRGSVDLVLERPGLAIACEITVTTTVDHEVGNILKCAESGFANIVAVGVAREKLAQLEAAVTASAGREAASRVSYFLPDELIEHLKSLPAVEPPVPETKTVKGYRVKKTYPKLSPEEAKAREDAGLRLIAEALAKTKRGGK